jgi:hypothetical protein
MVCGDAWKVQFANSVSHATLLYTPACCMRLPAWLRVHTFPSAGPPASVASTAVTDCCQSDARAACLLPVRCPAADVCGRLRRQWAVWLGMRPLGQAAAPVPGHSPGGCCCAGQPGRTLLLGHGSTAGCDRHRRGGTGPLHIPSQHRACWTRLQVRWFCRPACLHGVLLCLLAHVCGCAEPRPSNWHHAWQAGHQTWCWCEYKHIQNCGRPGCPACRGFASIASLVLFTVSKASSRHQRLHDASVGSPSVAPRVAGHQPCF